ncbi:hypothetical protein ACFUN8_06585 [Streptomyces sp. NPDC057307]|uniref:hypothetical protein n=1 Tax=Streptomyces sp. NPDC057307 TaxID=3346096 RepID=UPI00363FF340
MIGFESWLERDRLILLDRDPEVVGVASQPFWLHWHDGQRPRRHAPDYFVRLADGRARVVDVRAGDRCRDQDYLQRQQNPAQPLAGHSVPTGPTCGFCRTPMQPASAARRWCSHACRQAAYRARKLGELPATALSRQNRAN